MDVTALLLESHRQAFGRPLLAGHNPGRCRRLGAQELFAGAEVVLAHGGGRDPRLIYANGAALRLWRRPWTAMVGLPSRLTAEPQERRARQQLLETAERLEAIRGYRGVRVDGEGRRFVIDNARLWTLRDEEGRGCGQAAAFSSWWWL
ncbi:MEKHLA domain-containing protein [Cyanobium sp. Morenito 9A2]|nr:MEKHLA domain-containing protein [Cyanobium sp. Morenito 9A2]